MSFTSTFLIFSKFKNTSSSSGRTATIACLPPAHLSFSAFCTAFARPTYCGSLRERVYSASPSGFERKEEVSPDGINSSVVVTGSLITVTTFNKRSFVSAPISGQSLIPGPNLTWAFPSAFPTPLKTLFSYMLLSKKYFGFVYAASICSAEVRYPLFAAVAAMERASISATEAI